MGSGLDLTPKYEAARLPATAMTQAIELGVNAVDIGKTIHPHPTLGESIGLAAEVARGSCMDLPPARK